MKNTLKIYNEKLYLFLKEVVEIDKSTDDVDEIDHMIDNALQFYDIDYTQYVEDLLKQVRDHNLAIELVK